MSNNQKHQKKAKLRHAEYYDMQSVQDIEMCYDIADMVEIYSYI